MPFNTKEKEQLQGKKYRKTESGKKSIKICGWKQHGMISDDWDKTYTDFNNTTTCPECKVVFSTDKIRCRETKCLHHDHSIKDTHNIIGILCHACNLKYKEKPGSSEPHITWDRERKKWRFSRTINKVKHSKRFDYFIQAVIYKKEFCLKNNIV